VPQKYLGPLLAAIHLCARARRPRRQVTLYFHHERARETISRILPSYQYVLLHSRHNPPPLYHLSTLANLNHPHTPANMSSTSTDSHLTFTVQEFVKVAQEFHEQSKSSASVFDTSAYDVIDDMVVQLLDQVDSLDDWLTANTSQDLEPDLMQQLADWPPLAPGDQQDSIDDDDESESPDCGDVVSEASWSDDWPEICKNSKLDTSENTIMLEILAAEKKINALGASFYQDGMATVFAKISEDSSDAGALATLDNMMAELVELGIGLAEWLKVVDAQELLDSIEAYLEEKKATKEAAEKQQADYQAYIDGLPPQTVAEAELYEAELQAAMDGHLGIASPKMSQEAATAFTDQLEKLEISSIAQDDMKCLHCWGNYGEEDGCQLPVKTPCGHVYGQQCLIESLVAVSLLCPLCRVDIVALVPLPSTTNLPLTNGDQLVQQSEIVLEEQSDEHSEAELE
jgi:hypothetical protein